MGGNHPRTICLHHSAAQLKKRDANNAEWPQSINWNRELLSMPRHWTCLGCQRRPAIPRASQTKPTTEASKCRNHPHQSILQSHPFRSLQKHVQTDNNHEKKQELPREKDCPQHFQVLQHTCLITKKIPTLTQQRQHNKETKVLKQIKDGSNSKRNRMRTIHFCIGHSDLWSEPVRTVIKTVKDKFNFHPWLRVFVSCHRFTNLREIFQWDLSGKLTVCLTSQCFEPLPHNCRTWGTIACAHNNVWMNSKAVDTEKAHMGNTVQKFKAGTQQHFNEVHKLVKLSKKPDSCATHFANQFHNTNPSPTNLCGGTTCSIIWQGNPVRAKNLQKTVPGVLKRELQFLNNPNPTHSFLSTLTMKSAPCAHALMSQSMMQEPVQPTKSPQILLGTMFAC